MEIGRTYSDCQSCGMPMKKDAQGGGTNADGTKSAKYCSHCYQGGRFTMPDATADQMRELVKGKLKEYGMPGFMAGMLARKVPTLERWKSSADG